MSALDHTTIAYNAVSPAATEARRTTRETEVLDRLADLTAAHDSLSAARIVFAPEVTEWPASS